ncbi:ATP-binding protein [Streptomyces sp. ISL-100]|uniref:ATP-binding protein n=1 Tax=Streptomyces sp. ISL-100 TaxID=2819173 RepID=UPI001BEA08BC|nr:ATP-binding protein [Streptomyces sp. ISL-100]MBT2401884.1 HAMP domain-containing protein [Streptomyces sp. ISL-100]
MRRRTENCKNSKNSENSGHRLPLRKSLLGRLLAVSALVAACSVAATAWLAVQTTSGAIKQEQGRNLTADTRIYNTLLGYAAGHPKWDDVEATVRQLADESGRRITLTTQNRDLITDSADTADTAGQATPQASALPPQASAVVDPLSVDTAVSAGPTGAAGTGVGATGITAVGASADRVDPRAVGPFRLPTAERTTLKRAADRAVECLSENGIAADVVQGPSGRPRIQVVGNDPDRTQGTRCGGGVLDEPTATERKALGELNKLADACLDRQGREGVTLNLDLAWGAVPESSPAPSVAIPQPVPAPSTRRDSEERAAAPTERPSALNGDADRAIASCVGTARREQLSSYVASPALLFIGDPGDATVPGFDISPGNTAKIAGVAALVLALTVGASVLAGARLVRPLHALTGAAQRMRDGEDTAPVLVTADNEIGRLAAAFNDMSAHRTRLEQQRKVMVSDVAHELRTPLSNIRGWLEGAQDGIADPDAAFISSLLEEALQLQHIIDDLQDLSAADAGALRVHPEAAVRVEELLSHVAAAHQARADASGVCLTVTASASEGPALTVTADPVRLRQAVGNLVSNAVRHTPAGGRVTLRAYATGSGSGSGAGSGEDGRWVALEVADTGSGIAPEDLPYVFERFWRAEKSRNRRSGGSGLGLAIVRKLVEAHGGTASAVSNVGEGSFFTLRLPAGGTGAADLLL